MNDNEQINILIIEDGDEYFSLFSRFLPRWQYHQAHDCEKALEILSSINIQIIFLDMRFDRIPTHRLVGDPESIRGLFMGDRKRAEEYLAEQQGMFILERLYSKGYSKIPILMLYDFQKEMDRYNKLKEKYPLLSFIPPDADTEYIIQIIDNLGVSPCS